MLTAIKSLFSFLLGSWCRSFDLGSELLWWYLSSTFTFCLTLFLSPTGRRFILKSSSSFCTVVSNFLVLGLDLNFFPLLSCLSPLFFHWNFFLRLFYFYLWFFIIRHTNCIAINGFHFIAVFQFFSPIYMFVFCLVFFSCPGRSKLMSLGLFWHCCEVGAK